MKRTNFLILLLILSSNIIFAEPGSDSAPKRVFTIENFIKTSVEKDTAFEEILIDQLALKYRKDLNLPARDFVLSVTSQYEFNMDTYNGAPRNSVSLSRLLVRTATDVSVEYKTTPSSSLAVNSSEVTLQISQPIAENAFGRGTVLEDKIIGAEIDIIEYQVIEAYEDYLAYIITAYYSWYSAYENLKIGRSSYEQSQKLLENINKRKESKIALPIDVNKINIQTLTKKEELIKLNEKYDNIFNFIKQAIRYKGTELLEPADPLSYNDRDISFDADYRKFTQTSRTYSALKILEQKSSLQLKKYADDLLPSVNLILGYNADGDDTDINDADKTLYSGISVTWPFPGQEERAQHETSKITHRKTQVSNKNKYVQLNTDLKNLYIQIEREKKLVSITREKIALAESILEDETKNYSYGKVSLNDFIDAVNEVDKNKFDEILHSVQLKIIMTEWLRMTDQLISRRDLKKIK